MEKLFGENGQSLSWKPLSVVFLSALLVRVAVMLVLQSWEFKSNWEFGWELAELGQSLVKGNGFTRIRSDGQLSMAAFPPVYPIILAVFFSIFGTYSRAAAVGVFMFQSVCAGVIAVLLAVIGTRLWNAKIGVIAALIWAIYPTSIFYSVIHVWYCELAAMLLFLAVAIAVAAQSPPSLSRAALFGTLSGVIILTDPTLSIYLAMLLLWMLIRQGAKLPGLVVLLLTGGLAVGAVLSPWAIHNWLVLGSPRIVKSNFGEALYLGNNPVAEAGSPKAERLEAYTTLDEKELNYYRNQSELVADRYFMGKALEWIQDHPFRFAQLTAKRIYYFWLPSPGLGRKSWLRFAYFGPLLALALYGLWIGGRHFWQLTPIWLFMLIYPLPYYLTHVAAGRYSYPVEPFVVLLAAIPIGFLFQRVVFPQVNQAPA
jgi:4-amino-4-deoxy-L-arabinose transferase-like glycosyltransferase